MTTQQVSLRAIGLDWPSVTCHLIQYPIVVGHKTSSSSLKKPVGAPMQARTTCLDMKRCVMRLRMQRAKRKQTRSS